MNLPRFYISTSETQNNKFELGKEESHHVASVYRKKKGDTIELFDGNGRIFTGIISDIEKTKVIGRISSEQTIPVSKSRIRLFQGMPKGDKFYWILEKITEIGVSEIVPMYTHRTVTKIPKERMKKRMEHWEKILLSATKQSHYAYIPKIREPLPFTKALGMIGKNDLSIVGWIDERITSFKEVLRPQKNPDSFPFITRKVQFTRSPQRQGLDFSGQDVVDETPLPTGESRINIFIGPEGGFSPEEIHLAKEKGVTPVTFGTSILRTETAGLFALSCIRYEYGINTQNKLG